MPLNEADIAVFAVAGPVENGNRCLPPNIAWEIDLTRSELSGMLPPTVLITILSPKLMPAAHRLAIAPERFSPAKR
jgi:hypothetical protein